jgi:hypothetical protein
MQIPERANNRPPFSWRRVTVSLWRICLLAWLTLTLWPVAYGVTRLLQVLLFAIVWAGALAFWWRHRWLRLSLLLPVGVVLGFGLLPGRRADPDALRLRYVAGLRTFEGVRYVWGGENGMGIDCSGLVRRAWFNALWREAFASANPGLLREAARIWWNDSSARALAAGHQRRTFAVREFDSIASRQPAEFLPGDLAVTADGVHVLASLGEGLWIEADPGLKKVVVLPQPGEGGVNIWLNVPVTMVRWSLLSAAPVR